jgi:hypothetical protein
MAAPDSRRWRVDTKSPPCHVCGAQMIFAKSAAGWHLQCGMQASHYRTFEQWLTKCRRKYLTLLAYNKAEAAAVQAFNILAGKNLMAWRIKDDAERLALLTAVRAYNNTLETEMPD